jgi:hypothetical protein
MSPIITFGIYLVILSVAIVSYGTSAGRFNRVRLTLMGTRIGFLIVEFGIMTSFLPFFIVMLNV